jgi:hypothetical protein
MPPGSLRTYGKLNIMTLKRKDRYGRGDRAEKHCGWLENVFATLSTRLTSRLEAMRPTEANVSSHRGRGRQGGKREDGGWKREANSKSALPRTGLLLNSLPELRKLKVNSGFLSERDSREVGHFGTFPRSPRE